MRIIDVDAHLHEPLDWVEQTDPKLMFTPVAKFSPSTSSRRIGGTWCRPAS